MKKSILILALFVGLLASAKLFAAKEFSVDFRKANDSTMLLSFSFPEEVLLREVSLNGVDYQEIVSDISTVTNQKGWAELPFVSASVQLPPQKNVTLRLVAADYHDIALTLPLVPSRGVIYRNQDPKTIAYSIAAESLIDQFYPAEMATMESPFIVRDVRGTSVRIFPYQYNAVTKTLRHFTHVQVALVENDAPATNPLLRENPTPVKEAVGLYNSMFLNYEAPQHHAKANATLPISEYGDILVVATQTYANVVTPYIKWKQEKGYNVALEIVSQGENIKTLIKNKYDQNPNLMFVQIVGDWADIKSPTITVDGSSAPTDPHMGCVSGNDNYPDVAIGRFSCSNTNDLAVQINKAIDYELTPNMAPNWRETAICVASSAGPGDDNEIDYTHISRIYEQRLANFTYNTVKNHFGDAASRTELQDDLNAGASTLAYCGHGDYNAFETTGFNNSNVNALTNGDKLPFIVSVACLNGAFHKSSTCFAEAWLRKENGGAVVTWMSTINQPWEPPQRGQDYFYDILVGGFTYSSPVSGYNTNEQRTHWGAITLNAANLMLMESSYEDDLNTVKTWTTFGDASLQLRTKQPMTLTLSDTVVHIGEDFTGIAYCNGIPMKNVLICISQNGVYYHTLTADDGAFVIPHDFEIGDVLLVATAFNTTTIYQRTQCSGETCDPVVNLQVTTSTNDVTLHWQAPAASNINGYNIYCNNQLVGAVPASANSFTKRGLNNGTYNFFVTVLYDGQECYVKSAQSVVVDDGLAHDCLAVEALELQQNGAAIALSWGAPATSEIIVFDDVESHTAFAINSAGAAGWSFIDGDGAASCTFSQYNFTNESSALATIIFDPAQITKNSYLGTTSLTQNEGVTAHSGNQFFAFITTNSTPNDDWLISPALTRPTRFSFFARGGHNSSYVESFEIATSTTGKAKSDFSVLATVNAVPAVWTEYSYNLPANTKYVAIHYNAHDQYYLCIDDLKIEAEGTTPSGYEIYCNGVSVETTTDLTFSTANAHNLQEYCVEAIYENGCRAPRSCYLVSVDEDSDENGEGDGGNGGTNPTSISENFGKDIQIFPNPANVVLTISADAPLQIELLNTIGQVVLRQKMEEKSMQIDISQLHSGIYFVRFSDKNRQTTRKIIIQ